MFINKNERFGMSKMPRKTKQQEIDSLKEQLRQMNECMLTLERRHAEVLQKADQEFAISSFRYQMQEEIDFLKSLNKLTESNYNLLKRKSMRQQETIQLLYKKISDLSDEKGIDYQDDELLGSHEPFEISVLEDSNRLLSAKLQTSNEKVDILLKEIEQYQAQIGELKSNISRKPHVGRNKLADEMQKKILEMREKTDANGKPYSIRKIAAEVGCSVGVVHKYLKEWNGE